MRKRTAGKERAGETLTHRKTYVSSDELRIAGFADVVEEDITPYFRFDHVHADEIILGFVFEEHPVNLAAPRFGRWQAS